MAEWLLLISAVSTSLVYLGILRTAVWLVVGLLLQDSLYVLCASFLAFFASASILIPPTFGSFDFRNLARERWTLLFFLTGALTGGLLWPTSIVLFMIGALIPLSFLYLFRVFRMPASLVYFMDRRWRILAPLLFMANLVLKFTSMGGE